MKSIFTLLLLLYCQSSNFLELVSNNTNLSRLTNNNLGFSFVSVSNAQALGEQRQQSICNKLRSADFNADTQVDDVDYSLLYLISLNEATALSEMEQAGLTLNQFDLLVDDNTIVDINDKDVSLLYNYLIDELPYCPYINL